MKIGTLSSILADVASLFGTTKQKVVDTLFGEKKTYKVFKTF